MLEQILQLVKEHGQSTVVNNPDVPNENNEAVMAEAANTLTGGLQNILSGGGLQSILSLFGKQSSKNSNGLLSNPVVSMMIGHLTNNLVKKLRLSPAAANNVSANIIPGVLNSLINRTSSTAPADNNFDLNDLISQFTQGSAANGQVQGIDFQSLLSQVADGGQVELDPNIVNQITEQAQTQQTQAGGLADLVRGFFK